MFLRLLKKIFSRFKKNKIKKLGLALGSGGAKGFFHVGALRAFEEEGITFDVISGSSIGAIVGALYASGFSSSSMVEYFKQLNLTDPMTLIKMKLSGMTVEKVLDRAFAGSNIEDLPLPFGAVAVDLYAGTQVDLTSGNTAKAVCASSAIPPLFKSVEINGKMLVDGAFLNNVPADLARKLGADFVLGINLGSNEPTNKNILVALTNSYKNHGVKETDRSLMGKNNGDFIFEPNLENYSSTSIDKLNELYEEGYEYAKKVMPEVKKILKRAKIKRG